MVMKTTIQKAIGTKKVKSMKMAKKIIDNRFTESGEDEDRNIQAQCIEDLTGNER